MAIIEGYQLWKTDCGVDLCLGKLYKLQGFIMQHGSWLLTEISFVSWNSIYIKIGVYIQLCQHIYLIHKNVNTCTHNYPENSSANRLFNMLCLSERSLNLGHWSAYCYILWNIRKSGLLLYTNIDQKRVNSLHRLLHCEIGGLPVDCHVITTEYRTRVHCIQM